MRVALYLRVSTEEQVRGFSLDTQREDLIEWAKREGWQVAGVYEDPGVSGTDALKRPGFQAMVLDAKHGKFERVLVKARSRYTRNIGDDDYYGRIFGAVGVTVWSLSEPGTNGTTADAFLMRGITNVLNAHYSVDLSLRVTRGKQARAAKGLHNGVIPFGYQRFSKDEPLAINPEEAEVVRYLYNMYLAGTPTTHLSLYLNDNGYRTRRNSLWQVSTVRELLRNQTYTGDLMYRGQVAMADAHPAIIDRTTFAAAVDKKQPRIRRRQRHEPSMLTGFGTCSQCGHTVWTNRAKGQFTYYRCSNKDSGIERCTATSVQTQVLDALLSDMMLSLRLPEDWQAVVLDESAQVRRSNERERMETQLRNLQRMVVDGLYPYEKGSTEIKLLQRQLTEIQEQPEIVDIGNQFTEVIDLWPYMNPEERRKTLQTIFDTVSIDIPNKRLAAVKPKPVFESLFPALARDGGPLAVCAGDSRLESTLQYTNRLVGTL